MDESWWRVLTKCGPLEKEMANHFSILALRSHEQYEKAKDRALKDELPRPASAQNAAGDQWRITPERMKGRSQSKNNTQLWM